MIRFFVVVAMLCMAPVRRLDQLAEQRGQDREAGLTTCLLYTSPSPRDS